MYISISIYIYKVLVAPHHTNLQAIQEHGEVDIELNRARGWYRAHVLVEHPCWQAHADLRGLSPARHCILAFNKQEAEQSKLHKLVNQ